MSSLNPVELEARTLFGNEFRRLNLLAQPLFESAICDHNNCEKFWTKLILIRMFEIAPTVYQFKACDEHSGHHGQIVSGPAGFPWRL